jgi:ribulose-5-phosphate 4-epimerase/fuculose-1-phosphate aldolase
MMANHGVTVIGRTVAEAFHDLYFLERSCQVQLLAMQSGKPLKQVAPQIAQSTFGRNDSGESAMKHFTAMKRLLDREEPDYAL